MEVKRRHQIVLAIGVHVKQIVYIDGNQGLVGSELRLL